MEIKERIQLLLSEMNRGVYEKEAEIGLSLLAALAGESILLLGPPGVAKSMVARRLKRAFVDARAVEYLMSRFSTPDEIFGPVSISRLKESDKYERAVDGYLPTADVVFLDEIWKAGPAIQNTLLTVINEKLFRNGDTELKLPLKLLVAASNELPTQGEGLEALWDRFLIRIISTCVKQEEAFYQMLLDDGDEEEQEACRWQISDEEYAGWQKEIRQIKVSAEVLSCITEIRKNLEKVEIQGSEVHRNVYVSDRRWKNIVKLLKASAFIHGRKEVCLTDLLPVYHCLWNEPEECADIRQIVVRALFVPYVKEIAAINLSLKSDLKVSRVREALEKARQKGDLPLICEKLKDSHVIIYADPQAYQALEGRYPAELLEHAKAESFGTEFLDYKMAVKTVKSFEDALGHIQENSSKHSECIVTENGERAALFTRIVDAACVYTNVSTAFTDGAQFGLGAEIGISTQKLHARGPMGLEEITSYKWVIEGDGQTRRN